MQTSAPLSSLALPHRPANERDPTLQRRNRRLASYSATRRRRAFRRLRLLWASSGNRAHVAAVLRMMKAAGVPR